MTASLKVNLLAGYLGQIYVAVIGILVLPLLTAKLGREAFGLIGFFTSLQALFLLLDMGLTQTISREMTRYMAGELSPKVFLARYRAVLLAFIAIAISGGALLYLAAAYIAMTWLDIQQMDVQHVVLVVQILALVVASRWLSGIFRGVISGAERLVWLNAFNSLVATCRFPGVFVVFALCGYDVLYFFSFQLVMSVLELVVLYLKARTLLPADHDRVGWSLKPLADIGRFAFAIAGTSIIWVVVTQFDKMLVSGLVSLADFGVFTLAVTVASGLLALTGPVGAALSPRLTSLQAAGQHGSVLDTYRKASQLVAVLSGSISATIWLSAEALLYGWSGDRQLAADSANVLRWYTLGNFFLSLNVFPFYLQFARGMTRYHVYGHLLLLVFMLPAMYGAVRLWGVAGAGWCWAGIHACYFFGWVGYSHWRLVPGFHWLWVSRDLLPILLVVAIPAVILTGVMTVPSSRWYSLLLAVVSGVVLLALAVWRCRWMWQFALQKFKRS